MKGAAQVGCAFWKAVHRKGALGSLWGVSRESLGSLWGLSGGEEVKISAGERL